MVRRLLPLGVAALAAACSQPDPQVYWNALSAADPVTARAIARNDRERHGADALASALAGGSAAAAADLIALGADPDGGAVRDWARRSLLHLLRIEGDWSRLANLHHDHPELGLSPTAAPAAFAGLPRVHVTPPDAPVRLAWLELPTRIPTVAAHLSGASGAATLPVGLDTGAAICTMTTAAAERLGVRFLGNEALPVTGVVGQAASSRTGVLPELSLGTWILHDVPIAVTPTLGVEDGDITVLIGWDVMQHVAIELSPRERTIVITRSAADANREKQNLVLLTEPLVRARCGEAPLLLIVDTGAVFSHVSRTAAARLGLATRAAGQRSFSGVGGETKVETELVTHMALQCDKVLFTCNGVPAIDRQPEPPGLPRIDGSIGFDLLGSVHVVIDGPARTLTLREQ